MLNLIEIENLEARFIREFGIKNLSYIIDLDTWVRDGLHAMRIPNYYCVKDVDLTIVNGRSRIKCATDMLIGAYFYTGSVKDFKLNNSFKLINRNDNNFSNQGFSTAGNMFVSIAGGYLSIEQQEGFVKLFYKDIPTDCNNKALVPVNPKVISALMYYFIYRMGLSGHQHPVINWNDAKTLWEQEYPAAGNDASWFNEEELQAFTELWTNPLIGDLHRDNYIY